MNDIHDIKDPIELFYNYIPILIIALILLFLIVLFIYLSLRKNKGSEKKVQSLNIKLDPRALALSELEKIRKDKLIELNRYQAFYTRLTNIIKIYLVQEYKLDTETNTTQEILEKVQSLSLSNEFNSHFEKCLKNYDYAKYSGYKVNEKDMNESFNLTKGLFKSI